MTKAELESKHLSELHSLAAEAGVPRYRMLRRDELIEKLLDGESGAKPTPEPSPRREGSGSRQRQRRPRPDVPPPPPAAAPPAASSPPAGGKSEPPRPRRKRRRRFRRRGRKGVRALDLLLPPPGRQALVYAETRAACTGLLRELAAGLAGASKGQDPIALLIDPSPEELADWKREAPQAEIVAAGQARHASDAQAQAARRAEAGEDVILLVDSLSRFDEAFGDAGAARELFDAGVGRPGNGSLTVIAALERR